MFFGSFWQGMGFYANNSNLDDLIQQQSPLEDFLDEENIVTDVRRNPKNFANYLTSNQQELRKMFDYVLEVPDENQSDQKKLYKYPFLVGELFSTNLSDLTDFLFDEEKEVSNKSSESGPRKRTDSEQEEANKDLKKDNNDEDPEEKEKEQVLPIGSNDANEPEFEDALNKTPVQGQADATVTPSTEEKVSDQTATTATETAQEPKQEQTVEAAAETTPTEEQKIIQNIQKVQEEEKQKEDTPVKKRPGQSLLLHIFEFLETSKPENYPISSGYFQKLMSMLINQQGALSSFLHSHPKIVQNFIQKIGVKSISDTLARLITLDGIERTETIFEENRKQILNDLIQKFSETHVSDELENITAIIHEIVEGIKNSDGPAFESLFAELCQKENLQLIVSKISNQDTNASYYSLYIINDIAMGIDYPKSITQSDPDEVNCEADNDNQTFNLELKTILEKSFSLIEKTNLEIRHKTTFGIDILRLGQTNLQVIELFCNFLQGSSAGNPIFVNFITDNKIFDLLFDLIDQYEWNNILQSYVEKIIKHLLEHEKETKIRTEFLNSKYLTCLKRIFTEDNGHVKVGPLQNEITRGYFSFYMKLTQSLRNFKNFPQAEFQDWQDILNSELFKGTQEREKKNLGDPSTPNSPYDEPDSPPEVDVLIKPEEDYRPNEEIQHENIEEDINDDPVESIKVVAETNEFNNSNFWKKHQWNSNDPDMITSIIKELECSA